MKRLTWMLLALAFAWTACTSTKSVTNDLPQSPALLTFDLPSGKQDVVTKAEFERVYAKNNGGPDKAKLHPRAELREYLDLYIKFKRKVYAAEAKGLDTTTAFKQEFETYRKQLAQPYLRAKEVEDRLVEQALERNQESVKASHLLIRVDESALPNDTLIAYNRIMRYRDSITSKAVSFGDLAERVSEDPSAKQNKGSLGYFSVFDMVYPFENAAFQTAVGDVSMPIRTQFGYHLIYVEDRIRTSGPKRVAHIIVRVGDRYGAKTETQAEARINEIYAKLKGGQSFGELAQQYSDDPSSRENGGDLGEGRLIPEMENLKMTLSAGEYSRPFKTQFGWHILQVTESANAKPAEEVEAEIRNRVARDTRSQLSRTAMIDRIKESYNFTLESANVNQFKSIATSDLTTGNWKATGEQEAIMALPLFHMFETANPGKKDQPTLTRTLKDMMVYYKENRIRFPRLTPIQAVDKLVAQYTQAEAVAYEEARLPAKNPEYRHLLKEYRDGILLFTLMEDMVWRKAVEDTLGLQRFYDDNLDQFSRNKTMETMVYLSSDLSKLNVVQRMLGEGYTDRQIDSMLNKSSSLAVTVREQSFEQGEDDIDGQFFAKSVGYVSSPFAAPGGGFRLIRITGFMPAGTKSFEEARPEAITLYQDYLEQDWLKDLGYRYPVKISETVFDRLYK